MYLVPASEPSGWKQMLYTGLECPSCRACNEQESIWGGERRGGGGERREREVGVGKGEGVGRGGRGELGVGRGGVGKGGGGEEGGGGGGVDRIEIEMWHNYKTGHTLPGAVSLLESGGPIASMNGHGYRAT